jgi:chorismate mutase
VGESAERRVRAERGAGSPPDAGSLRATSLGSIRRRIDALDRRIVRLMNERARLGLEAGVAKAERGRAVRDAARESDVLRRVVEASEGPLPPNDVTAIYRRLMAATRRLEAAERRTAGRGQEAPPRPGENGQAGENSRAHIR